MCAPGDCRWRRWHEASKAISPDLVVVAALAILILVGVGVLDQVVLVASVGTLSLAAFLYRLRGA